MPFAREAAMITVRRAVLLCAALCLGTAAPAWAQEPGNAATESAAAETVTIPFDPPLGTPLTYAMRFERKRPGGDSAYDYEHRLTFERTGDGFVLRLETLAFIVGGQRLDLADKRVLAAIPAALRPYLMPMAVELDAAGEMVRMRDWEAMRANLRGLPETAAKLSDQPMDEAALAAVRSVLDPIINSSAEDAPGFMIRGWPAVLGYGGAEFVLGETIEAETEMTGGIFPQPVPAILQGSLSLTSSGSLQLVQNAVIDPEGLREGVLSLLERLRAQGAGKGAPDPADAIAAISMTEDTEIEFDARTGLPVTARLARLTKINEGAGIDAGTGGEILTITWIVP